VIGRVGLAGNPGHARAWDPRTAHDAFDRRPQLLQILRVREQLHDRRHLRQRTRHPLAKAGLVGCGQHEGHSVILGRPAAHLHQLLPACFRGARHVYHDGLRVNRENKDVEPRKVTRCDKGGEPGAIQRPLEKICGGPFVAVHHNDGY